MKLLRTKKRKFAVFFLFFVILIIVATVLFSHWANAPVEQNIHIANEGRQTVVKPTYQDLKTAYYTTTLPGGWRVQQRAEPNDNLRWNVVSFPSSGGVGQVAILTAPLPDNGFTGIGDYYARVTNPATYTPFTDASFPAGSKAFKEATGPPAEILYIENNGRFASIAVTNEPTDAASLALIQLVIGHWIWV